jgi:hypothetical protein
MPSLPETAYVINNNGPNGLKWTVEPFTYATQPVDHSFCGDFAYIASWDNQLLSSSTEPAKFDESSLKYTFYSED